MEPGVLGDITEVQLAGGVGVVFGLAPVWLWDAVALPLVSAEEISWARRSVFPLSTSSAQFRWLGCIRSCRGLATSGCPR